MSILSEFSVKLGLCTRNATYRRLYVCIDDKNEKVAAERTHGQHRTRISSFEKPRIDVRQHTSFPAYHPQIPHGMCEGRRQDSRPLLLCGKNVPSVYSHRASAARKFRHAAPGN